MAHNEDGKGKQVHYVGDSRVKVNNKKLYPKDYSEFPGKTEAFFPNFLLKEWMVAVVVLVGFLALTMAHEPPLGEQADPTNTSFLPVPDWYFLFLYELLKFSWASGPFVVIGTIVVPGVMFTALLLVPWLDRSKERRPFKRPITTGIMMLSLVAIVALTWVAEDEHQKQLAALPKGGDENTEIVAVEHPGFDIYKNNACVNCHGQELEGLQGPGLRGIGDAYTREEMIDLIDNGKGTMPAGMFQGTEEEKQILVDWLLMQKPAEDEGEQQEEQDQANGDEEDM
jgi:menaquinol-cytochrome c reductase cytochrome b/c subunit